MFFEDYSVASDEYRVQQCKIGIRDMVQSLKTKIGSIRTVGRYHQEGTRTLGNDYAVTNEVLGTGMTGIVRLAHGKTSRENIRFAVKSYDLKKITSAKREAQLIHELEIHMTVDHPHIVELVDIYEAKYELHLVMECMDGGELNNDFVQRKIPSSADAADIVRQILISVSYLHGKDIVHRDLKPENFLYDKPGGSHLKLIDFGFSTWWREGDVDLNAPCGTLSYIAPEVLSKSYTKQCDLWSVGVIAFTLLGGHLPFDGSRSTVVANIKAGEYTMQAEHWKNASENARAFVLALMTTDYHQRLTANAALEHPWLLEARVEPQLPEIHSFVIQGLRSYKQASSLQRVCCSIACMSPCVGDTRSELSAFFMKMDTSGAGAVKLEDFKEALSGKLGESDEAVILDSFFATLDKDEAGRVQYSTFLAAMELASNQNRKDRASDIFRRFDTNDAGYITKKNVQEMLSRTSLSDEKLQQLFIELDFGDRTLQQLLKELDFGDRRRIPYDAFEACLTQPKTHTADSRRHTVAGYPDEILKKRPEIRQHLLKWQERFSSNYGKFAVYLQPEYVVDSESIFFEISDHRLMRATNLQAITGIA